MSNKLKNKNHSYHTKNLQDYIMLLPVMLVILVVPLIVRGIQVNTYLSDCIWYSKATKAFDIFLYSKSLVFITSCCLMLICVLILTFKKSIDWRVYFQRNKIYILPLGIYMILAGISTILSDYTRISLRGMVEHYETVWVLLGYGILTFYIGLFLKEQKQVHILINIMVGMIAVVTVIGLTQFFKLDFFQTALGSSLISKDPLSFRFNKGHVYASLYNPNYVGVFTSLIIPLLISRIIYTKVTVKKLLYGGLTIGVLCCAYGAKSSSGIIGIFAGTITFLILLALVYRTYWIKYFRNITIIISTILFSIIGVGFIVGNQYIGRMKQHHLESRLTEIQTQADYVSIIYNNNELKIQFNVKENNYSFVFLDSNNNEITYDLSTDGQFITIKDESFNALKFYVLNYDGTIVFGIDVDDSTWYFTNQTDGTYYYCNVYGKLLKLNQQEEFKNYWSIGSGRGYIWDRTLPIIKEHWLLGTGPDTYAMYFPNTEYLNLYHSGFQGEVITKPHSIYLQIAAQTGIPSLLAFISFYLIYLVSSIRLFIKKIINTYEVQIGIAILAGTTGYMVACLANDSTVAVAPLFWTLIGIGIGINHIVKKDA